MSEEKTPKNQPDELENNWNEASQEPYRQQQQQERPNQEHIEQQINHGSDLWLF